MKGRKKEPKFACPACRAVLTWNDMFAHFQDRTDRKHRELESELENHVNNAYFDAEFEWIEQHCTHRP